MIYFIAMLQATQGLENKNPTLPDTENSAAANVSRVLDQSKNCMLEQSFSELKANPLGVTPKSAANQALKNCSQYKAELVTALRSEKPTLSIDSVHSIADKNFSELEIAVTNKVDKFLSRKDFVEMRRKLSFSVWGQCVRNNSKEWSGVNEPASIVAKAVISSCGTEEANVRRALYYSAKAAGISQPDSETKQLMESFRESMRDLVIETVISERAKKQTDTE